MQTKWACKSINFPTAWVMQVHLPTTHKYLVRDHRERHLYMFWPIYPVVSHIFDWKAGLSIFLPQKLKFRERERVRERGREKWKVPTFFQCGSFPGIYCSSRKHGVTISKIWINLCNIRFRLLHCCNQKQNTAAAWITENWPRMQKWMNWKCWLRLCLTENNDTPQSDF